MADIIPVSMEAPEGEILIRAAGALKRGKCIAVPTDTLYGLCARALDREAIDRLFAVKGRTEKKGAPVLIGLFPQLYLLTDRIPAAAQRLVRALWPGPLTLIFPARPHVSRVLCGGGDGVAVRLPGQALCRTLARWVGPFAATSANPPGAPPFARAREVAEAFGEKLEMILDGGALGQDSPSSVVDVRGEKPLLIREGPVAFSEVEAAWGE
ncbi:MAG: L-threonylcarbamoyladenylate synthase [bacterium]|nr:L-threonylcarbamoyladenylate synthase [bacterium]